MSLRLTPVILLCLLCPSLHAQWTAQNPGTTQTLKTVEVVNETTFFVGGTDLFLRSTNGGTTWANVPVVTDNGQAFTNFTINDLHFFDASTGIAVGVKDQSRQFILRTVNGGTNWKIALLAPGTGAKGLQRLQFLDNNTGFASGDAGKIRKTVDGGQNWTLLATTWIDDNYALVDFVNAQRGYAVGSNALGEYQFIKTLNGGAFWESVAKGTEAFTDLDMVNSNIGFLSTEKVLYRIGDGHFTVDRIFTPDSIGPRRLYFRTLDTGYVLTPRTVRRSTNSGYFWEETALPLGANQTLLDFDWTANGLTGVAVGTTGAVFKTTNGGGTYTPMAIFASSSLYFCKGQPVTLSYPAPAGAYTSTWLLDGQVFSTAAAPVFVPSDYDTPHTLSLILSKGAVSDTFALKIKTEPDPDFPLSEPVFDNLPECGGEIVAVGVDQSVPGVYYTVHYDGNMLEGKYGFGGPLRWMTTSYIFDTTLFEIRATRFTNCGTLEKTSAAFANITPYPNGNLLWQPDKTDICYGNAVKIIVENSEIGVRYRLRENTSIRSDLYAGNGGRLEFFSYPLTTAGRYELDAYNVFDCYRNVFGNPYLTVTNLFLQVDTLHSYGVAGSPIPIENPETTLTASRWTFGPQAVPPVSTAASPVVVYAQAGSYPFTYEYDSNVGCSGVVLDTMEVYPKMEETGSTVCAGRPLEKMQWQVFGERVIDQHIDRFGNRFIAGSSGERGVFSFDFENFMLRKYDPSGNLLWDISAKFQDMWNVADDYRNSYAVALASDSMGNVYVSGSYASKGVVIAGQQFINPLVENKYQSQGFILKFDPAGKVLWTIHLTQPAPEKRCIPTDLAWGRDGNLYVALSAEGWRGFFADNSVVTHSNAETEAWLLVIDKEGRFKKTTNAGLVSRPGTTLLTAYNPFYNPLVNTATAIYPKLTPCPDGQLLLTSPFAGNTSIAFGGTVVEGLIGGGDGQTYNFLAALYDPLANAWTAAFPTHSVRGNYSSLPRELLYDWPVAVDANGDIWSGFYFNAPYSGGAGILPQQAKIGANYGLNAKSGAYLFKYSAKGQVKWVRENTQMRTLDLLADAAGNCFAYGSYFNALAFQKGGDQLAGNGGYGGEDLFLAKLNPDGLLSGLRTWGTAKHELPVRMAADRCKGFSLLSVDALLPNYNYDTAVAYTLITIGIDGNCAPDCPFAFEASLGDETVCKGSEVYFSALVSGTGYTCQWQQLVNGVWTDLAASAVFKNVQTATLSIRPVDLTLNNQFFRCSITNDKGVTYITNQAKLTVRQTPDIQQQPVDVSAMEGQTAVFSVEPVSAVFVQYQWQQRHPLSPNWENLFDQAGTISGASTKKLTLSNLQLGQDQYRFRCVLKLNGSVCDIVTNPATLSLLTGTTGLRDTPLRLFPNPFSGNQLILEGDVPQPERVALFNSLGQELAASVPVATGANGQYTLDLSAYGLVPGLYWVQVWAGGRRYVGQLVKN